MPLYELLCLAQPALQRQDLVRMMRRVGDLVMDKGGVLTNIVSYGEQHLAYDIRRPFQRFSKAHIWQMRVMVAPHVLNDINHELKVDPHVLRWIAVAQPSKARLNQEEVMSQLMAAEEQGASGAGAAGQNTNAPSSSNSFDISSSTAGVSPSQQAPTSNASDS